MTHFPQGQRPSANAIPIFMGSTHKVPFSRDKLSDGVILPLVTIVHRREDQGSASLFRKSTSPVIIFKALFSDFSRRPPYAEEESALRFGLFFDATKNLRD